jgi:hypothetical protein
MKSLGILEVIRSKNNRGHCDVVILPVIRKQIISILSEMDRLSILEYILIFAMLVVIVISGYLTIVRLVYGKQHICYDAWVFGTNTALLLQMYDNQATKK